MAEAFEYKCLRVTHTKGEDYVAPESDLNALGAQGWEIVSVAHGDALYENAVHEIYYFKRKT